MILPVRVVLVIVALLPLAPAQAAKGKDLILANKLPEITAEEKALTSVPFAPGAAAVALIDARQDEWGERGAIKVHRSVYLWRVKILTPAGIEKFGDYELKIFGDLRVEDTWARTVLPDGTVIDAKSNVRQGYSDSGRAFVRVAFPQVQVGAILEVMVNLLDDDYYAFGLAPIELQGALPILESRYVIIPPRGLQWKTVFRQITQEQAEPQTISIAGNRKAYAWSLKDVPALEEEAYRPPVSEIAKAMFVIPEHYAAEGVSQALSKDWASWSRNEKEGWEVWALRKYNLIEDQVKLLTEGKVTVQEKVEALRAALQAKVKLDYISGGPRRESPDDVWTSGSGTSADIAVTAQMMLKKAGIGAALSPIRRKSDGPLLPDFPIPALFNDILVRVDTEKGPVFWSPSADLPFGELPGDCRGILTFPLDGKTLKPVSIPDLTAADNRSFRAVSGQLDAGGAVAATTETTFRGAAAERWRRFWKMSDETARRDHLEGTLRRNIPGAQVTEMKAEGLEESGKEFKIVYQWQAEGFATTAGNRLVIPSSVYLREGKAAWAPEHRKYDVALGEPYEVFDSLILALPKGSRPVTAPKAIKLDSGAVGLYEASCDAGTERMTARRHMKLAVTRVSPDGYGILRQWFQAIADQDEQAVVISLPE